MKVQYCSDLHLEFTANSKFLLENRIKPIGDVLILAGDITYIGDEFFRNEFFDYISDNFEYTYWVPGNHEFYNGYDLVEFEQPIQMRIRSNIWLVNNVSITRNNVEFLFSTLWTKLKEYRAKQIQSSINDFYKIKHKGNLITQKEFEDQHQLSTEFLNHALTKSDIKKKVIVTHHVPSQVCNPMKYMTSPINSAFVVSMDDFIVNNDIDYWIYGHHHFNMPEQTIGKTKLLTNQLGYVHLGEHKTFNFGAYFNL